jgi:hypothetical protein
MEQSIRNHVNASISQFCRIYAPILEKRSEDLQQLIINQNNCLYSLEELFSQVQFCPYKVIIN